MNLFNLFLENELPSDIEKEVVHINYDHFKEELIKNTDLTLDNNGHVIDNTIDVKDLISETDFYEHALKTAFDQNTNTEFINKLKDSYQVVIDEYQCIMQDKYDEYAQQIKNTEHEWIHEFHQSYENMYGLPPYNPLMN